MPSYMRLAAEALGITGTRGSWARRIAQNATVIDGVTLGDLGRKGPWTGRLAAAMDRLTGSGPWIDRIAPGGPAAFVTMCEGGGADGYTTGAVTFDGATLIGLTDQLAALAADSPTGIMTLWVKGANIFNSSSNPAFVLSLANDTFDIKNALGVQNGFGVDFAEGPDFNSFYAMNNNSSPIPSGWTAILCSWDMNAIPGSRTFHCYYGDAVQSYTIEDDYGDPFSCFYTDTGWVFFGPFNNDACILADVADFQMWCGTTVDLSVQANRRLFIDANGKPVNPATAAASLGPPTVLFSGDHTTFATNQGVGGATSLLRGALTDAPSSPSD